MTFPHRKARQVAARVALRKKQQKARARMVIPKGIRALAAEIREETRRDER